LKLSESNQLLYEYIVSEYTVRLQQKGIVENLETSKTIHENKGDIAQAQQIEHSRLQLERRLKKNRKLSPKNLAIISIPLILLIALGAGIFGGFIGYRLP